MSLWLAIFVTLIAIPLLAAEDSQRRIWASSDARWLEAIVSDDTTADQIVETAVAAGSIRSQAYIRLGQLASGPALEALKRIEAAHHPDLTSPSAPLLRVADAMNGTERSLEPFVRVHVGVTTYGLVGTAVLGGPDLHLTTSRVPTSLATWTRPLLTPHRWTPGVGMIDVWFGSVTSGELRFEFNPVRAGTPGSILGGGLTPPPERFPTDRQIRIIQLKEIAADADGDGWTDLEEQRLGLDPRDEDSDDDGIADGRDVCPTYRSSEGADPDADDILIARTFFALYGVKRSRDLLLVPKSRPVALWGHRGPVLYGTENHQRFPFALLVGWSVVRRNDTDAEVAMSDYCGSLCAHGYRATLRKVAGHWVVVDLRLTTIS